MAASVVLIALALFRLAACGDDDDEETATVASGLVSVNFDSSPGARGATIPAVLQAERSPA